MEFTVEAARDFMARIADNLPQILKVGRRDAAFDEDKHPRVPAGGPDGGQWAGEGFHISGPHADGAHTVRDTRSEGGRTVTVMPGEKIEDAVGLLKQERSKDEADSAKKFAKVGASLAKAAEKKSAQGSVEKHFKPAKDSGYAGESAAAKDYEAAIHSVVAHYKANGWTETKNTGVKGGKGYFDAEFTKGGEHIKVHGKPHKSDGNSQGRSYTTSIVKTSYKLSVSHYKPNRSAAEIEESRSAAVNDEDPDIEFVPMIEPRSAGSASGPFRSLRATIGSVRRELLFGEPHLVVPVRALMEGVIYAHGAASPEFVPASSFSRMAMGWNVRPVMAGHPQVDGRMVSAASPSILDKHQIGWTFQSAIDANDGALDMEAWINERRAKLMGGDAADVVARLNKNETIEVSVGTHITADSEAVGEYKGKKYRGAWRETSPDHLAFLRTGDRGACSIEMGCGALRTNEGKPLAFEAEAEIRDELRAACDGKDHSPDGMTHTDGTPCACKGASITHRKDNTMIEEARINALVTKGTAVVAQIPFLKTLSAEQFAALEAVAAPEPVKKQEAAPVLDRAAIEAQVKAEMLAAQPKDAAAYVAAAPAEIRDLLSNGLRSATAHKFGLVAQLVALKERCPYDEAALKAMSTEALEGLIRLAGVQPATDNVVDFSGRGPVRRAAADNSVYADAPDPWAAGIKARQLANNLPVTEPDSKGAAAS